MPTDHEESNANVDNLNLNASAINATEKFLNRKFSNFENSNLKQVELGDYTSHDSRLNLFVWIFGVFVSMLSLYFITLARRHFQTIPPSWLADVFNNKTVLMISASLAIGALIEFFTRIKIKDMQTSEMFQLFALISLILMCVGTYAVLTGVSELQLYTARDEYEPVEYAWFYGTIFIITLCIGLSIFIHSIFLQRKR